LIVVRHHRRSCAQPDAGPMPWPPDRSKAPA
jgi:hypothetical protein